MEYKSEIEYCDGCGGFFSKEEMVNISGSEYQTERRRYQFCRVCYPKMMINNKPTGQFNSMRSDYEDLTEKEIESADKYSEEHDGDEEEEENANYDCDVCGGDINETDNFFYEKRHVKGGIFFKEHDEFSTYHVNCVPTGAKVEGPRKEITKFFNQKIN